MKTYHFQLIDTVTGHLYGTGSIECTPDDWQKFRQLLASINVVIEVVK